MSFEVAIGAVGRPRARWNVSVVVAVSVAIVALAMANADRAVAPVGPVSQPADAVAGASITIEDLVADVERDSSGRTRDGAMIGGRPPIMAVPADLRCRDLDAATCLRMVKAAVRLVSDEGGTVRTATVWRSLVCNDSLECPAHYLDRSKPLGSVVLTFAADGRGLAINVVDWQYTPGLHLGLRTWIARWMPNAG